jgi:hypothetical protein
MGKCGQVVNTTYHSSITSKDPIPPALCIGIVGDSISITSNLRRFKYIGSPMYDNVDLRSRNHGDQVEALRCFGNEV